MHDTYVMLTHDNIAGKGVEYGGTRLFTLGYADDDALLDNDKEVAAARVTSIAKGCPRARNKTPIWLLT